MLNENTLKVFMRVYETGSVTKAARNLFVSPQNVSRTIIDIEKATGQQLFTRNRRSLVPTAAAVKFKLHAEKILSEFSALRNEQQTVPDREELKVYCTYGVAEYLGAEFIQQLHQFRSDILLYLIEVPDKQALDLLRTRELAMAILSDPCDPGLYDTQYLTSSSYSYVIPRDSPLSGLPQITTLDIQSETIVGKGSEFQQYINQMSLFKDTSKAPYVIFETTSYHLSMQLARSGLAVAFVPDFIAEKYAPEGTVTKKLKSKEMEKSFYLVSAKGAPLTEKYNSFSNFLIEWAKHNPPDITESV